MVARKRPLKNSNFISNGLEKTVRYNFEHNAPILKETPWNRVIINAE